MTEKGIYHAALRIVVIGVLLNAAINHLDVLRRFLQWCVGITTPLLVGLAFALVLNGPVKLFEKYVFRPRGRRALPLQRRLARPLSMLLSALIALLIVVGILGVVLPRLLETVSGLFQQLQAAMPKLIQRVSSMEELSPEVKKWLSALEIDWTRIENSLLSFLRSGLGSVLSYVTTAATSVFDMSTNVVLAAIFALNILFHKEKLAAQLKALAGAYLKPAAAERVVAIGRLVNHSFSAFVSGQLTEALILGVLCYVGMLIFQFPNSFMISALVCVCAVIPMIGAFISCVLGTLFILLVNPWQGLGFLIFFLVLQQLEGNLIYPRVVGSSVGLPSMWVLAAVVVGGGVLGILGMLLAVPIFAVLYVILRQAVEDRKITNA